MKVIFCTISLLLSLNTFGQNQFAGNWEGKLDVGPGLRIMFHIAEENGKLTATMDSPDQGATGLAVNNTEVKGDSLFMNIAVVRGKYAGRLTDAQTISGQLQQGTKAMPLDLKKTERASSYNRPQTPKAPYAYKSEDVTYTSSDQSITYGATITIPQGEGPFPAVLLVSGSGQQNRDEEIFEHKPFAVIANCLTNAGYVVLRVDDRGVGKTTGNPATATTDDFVADATTGFNYLLSRKETDAKKTGILGHSEGGLIAEIMAAENKNIAFAILNGAPGIPITELMVEQNRAVLLQAGMSKELTDKYLDLYRSICKATIQAANASEAKKLIASAIRTWRANTDAATVMLTTGITNDETEQKIIEKTQAEFTTHWFRKFLSYNPQRYLSNVSCKVLAIGGEKDIQVIPASNLAGIKAALKKSKSKSYEVKELPGLNHLLQTCKTCTPQEYKELEETIAPTALETIREWLDKEVK